MRLSNPYPQGVISTDSQDWAWQDTAKRRGPPRRTASDLNRAIDASVQDGGYWEKGTFTVPEDTAHERVVLLGYKYIKRFGENLQKRGLIVHHISDPQLDTRPLPVPPDRKRYIMQAWVSRRPFQPIFDIPDKYVPEMLKAGLRLLE